MESLSNNEKQYIVKDNNSGKEFSMPRIGFENAKKNPAFHLWEKIGIVQPSDVKEVWYVNEDEKNRAISKRKPFCESFITDSYFRIIKRIDSTFIEGVLGHKNFYTDFFPDIQRGYTYFDDYLERKKIYLTFDKISLYQVTEIFKDNPVRLILKRIDDFPIFKPNTVFMIMPFGNVELDTFYEVNIRKFLKDEFNIDVYRADNYTDNDVIIETIYNSIEQSEFVIAETTGNNKNAFYELGYAVAKDREVITIQNKNEKTIFFDRAHVRSILYSVEDIEKFKTELRGTILTIRNRKK